MSARNGSRVIINRTTGPRTRSNKGRQLTEVPSLKEFIHRQSVVRQYRGFLRAVNCINDEKFRRQGRDEIRQQFGSTKNEIDQLAVRMAVKEVCASYYYCTSVMLHIRVGMIHHDSF